MKLGLVGIGYWGKNYIKTIKNINNIELSFVCSPHKKFEEELPENCRFTNNYDDILKDKQTQGIIIATPPKTHYDLARSGLISGKNVLIEKPMTYSSEEAFDLYRLSEEKLNILMVGHLFLYHPAVVQLKREVNNGELGNLVHINSIRTGPGPVRKDINAMWDLAPHDISMSNYFFQDLPTRVIATESRSIKNDLESSIDLILIYPNKNRSFIEVSWSRPMKKRKMNIFGSERLAIFDDMAQDKLIILDHYNPNCSYSSTLDNRSPLELECRKFVECIEKKEKPISDGYEGYINVRILECGQKSLDNGNEVDINFIPRI